MQDQCCLNRTYRKKKKKNVVLIGIVLKEISNKYLDKQVLTTPL